jgi:hypothetical protein
MNNIEKTIEIDEENSSKTSFKKMNKKEYENQIKKALDTLYLSPENYLNLKILENILQKFKTH